MIWWPIFWEIPMNTLDVQSTSVDQYGVFSAGQTGAGQPVSGEGTDFDSLLEPEAGQSSNASGWNKVPWEVDRMRRRMTPPVSLLPRPAPKGVPEEFWRKLQALTAKVYGEPRFVENTIPKWYKDLVEPGVPIEYVVEYRTITAFGGEGQIEVPFSRPVGETGAMDNEYNALLRQAMDQALNQNGIAEDDWAGYERAVTNADTSERIRRDVLAILAANPRAVELMDTLKIKA
jgi:hypothetical protein